ncbi:MAG TPA: BON domain-containing protein [Burkholderiaceae bacterium]|nr:BON domain-containing protein [Burkholderiaceae bacterium]
MRTSTRNVALLAALSLGLLAACGSPAPTADHYPPENPPRVAPPNARSPAQYNEDASISNRVQAAVLSVPGIYPQTLQISTFDGVVTLRGMAVSDVAARNVVQAARDVTGVRSVDYDIQVQPNAQVAPQPAVHAPYPAAQPQVQPAPYPPTQPTPYAPAYPAR